MMVMTILEARVSPENWAALEQAFKAGVQEMDSGIAQSFLIHSSADSTTWRIMAIWKSREALEQMRQSTETPKGVLMFRAASAEPSLSIFDVVAHATASAAG